MHSFCSFSSCDFPAFFRDRNPQDVVCFDTSHRAEDWKPPLISSSRQKHLHRFVGKTMLNLDTEDWNEIFIGCAGGGDSVIRLPIHFQKADTSFDLLELSVTGKSFSDVPLLSLDLALETVPLCDISVNSSGSTLTREWNIFRPLNTYLELYNMPSKSQAWIHRIYKLFLFMSHREVWMQPRPASANLFYIIFKDFTTWELVFYRSSGWPFRAEHWRRKGKCSKNVGWDHSWNWWNFEFTSSGELEWRR